MMKIFNKKDKIIIIMKTVIFSIIILLVIINISLKNKMTIYELIYFNYLLFLINNAGLVTQNKLGSYLLEYMTNDQIGILNHRKLKEKYGQYVETYIITNEKNYYILDEDLAIKILENSPINFNAGILKEEFFKNVMPLNLGIAKCDNFNKISKCPWIKLRKFNDNIMGLSTLNNLEKNIYEVLNNLENPPLDINDWKLLSYRITSSILFGTPYLDGILKEFYNEYEKPNFLKSKYYKKYEEIIKKNMNNQYSLLKNMYNLSSEIDYQSFMDQIPHIFAPTIFMINFLIPNLLCIILNFNEIYEKLIEEINKEDFKIINKNSYLHYCVIEHIRMFNTININIQRTAKYEMNLTNELKVKKGDQIFILFSSILRSSKIFKNPDIYEPDRWKNKKITDQDIVFGIGRQKCISVNFTPLIYKYIIYNLLKNYKLVIKEPILKTREIYNINPFKIRFENSK